MSREIKINDLVQHKTNNRNFWVVRNIIGGVAFIEMLCDEAGRKPHSQVAYSHNISHLAHAELALNQTIEYFSDTLTTLIAIKNQYAPSNEGYEKET